MNERSSKFAVWMTILWLGGIFSFYILGLFERPISFNELGDFLAGVFAPVAFLWLIYGYFQNSEALQAQIKEMNAGVKQQTELAEIQKQQFRAMLNAATGIVKIVNCKLSIDPHYNRMNQEVEYTYGFEFTLEAHVNELRNLKILIDETPYENIANIAAGESKNIRLLIFSELDERLGKFVRKEVEKYEFSFTISYQTIYGEEKREDFFYDFVEEKGEVIAKKPLWGRLGKKSPHL